MKNVEPGPVGAPSMEELGVEPRAMDELGAMRASALFVIDGGQHSWGFDLRFDYDAESNRWILYNTKAAFPGN